MHILEFIHAWPAAWSAPAPPGAAAPTPPSPLLLLGLGIGFAVALAALDFVLRLKRPLEPGFRPDERYWKAGVFYSNPDDPALFVPKPSGLGYTLNFARPGAWMLLAAVLAGPLSVIWLMFHVIGMLHSSP